MDKYAYFRCYFGKYEAVWTVNLSEHKERIEHITQTWGYTLASVDRMNQSFDAMELAAIIRKESVHPRAISDAEFLESLTGNNNG